MALDRLRGRMPLLAFILLAVLCLALLGFACACLSDHPMQALDRALATVSALLAFVDVWGPTAALTALATAFLVVVPARVRPSPAVLQRFLL